MSSNWKRSKMDNFILDSIVPDIDFPILKPKKFQNSVSTDGLIMLR